MSQVNECLVQIALFQPICPLFLLCLSLTSLCCLSYSGSMYYSLSHINLHQKATTRCWCLLILLIRENWKMKYAFDEKGSEIFIGVSICGKRYVKCYKILQVNHIIVILTNTKPDVVI